MVLVIAERASAVLRGSSLLSCFLDLHLLLRLARGRDRRLLEFRAEHFFLVHLKFILHVRGDTILRVWEEVLPSEDGVVKHMLARVQV